MRSTGSQRGFARLGQIFRRALEGGRIGQDRQTGRAAFLIGHGQRRRIEIGADQPLGGAGLLDLGDQAEFARRFLVVQGGEETARRFHIPGAGFQLGQLALDLAAATSSFL